MDFMKIFYDFNCFKNYFLKILIYYWYWTISFEIYINNIQLKIILSILIKNNINYWLYIELNKRLTDSN